MNTKSPEMKTVSVGGVDYGICLPNWETDYIQSKIFNSGEPYELSMLNSMAERLGPGDLVLDVGANIGNHSLFLASVVGCVVHAFEPNTSLCNALQKSVETNGLSRSVFVHNVGVGSRPAKARFANQDSSNLGGQSISVSEDSDADIDVVRLDDIEFGSPIAAIKVDVEGMELPVLKGATGIINRDKPLLYIESQTQSEFETISKILASHGYIFRKSYNATPTHLFVHREQVKPADDPAKTCVALRSELYECDEALKKGRQQLNGANLKYREASERLSDARNELTNAIQREGSLKEQVAKLKRQLEVAQQSPFFILRKNLSRLKRGAVSRAGRADLLRSLTRRLLNISSLLARKISQTIVARRNDTATQPFVPPRNLSNLNIDPLRSQKIRDLRVACIMDEFTWSSYHPECQLSQLTPANWQTELEECNPDLLFIESAWRGKDQLWGSKVGHASRELQEILRWCRERHIPTMFWNKEDPVHFETFLNTARLFDYVFTTDIDCVARYKAILGHNEVYFLPFACQPREHNPIEKYVRKDMFCFAGAYYARYPERTRDLEGFVATLPEYRPLEIFDRNYDKDDPNYAFPPEFQPHIVGTLPFSEIDKAYKGYRYAINLNSIKQSQTMFARRVYELLASNTLTVSNYSRGLRLMFGDLVLSSDSGNQLAAELESIESSGKTDRVRLAALRKVLSEHTYEDRLAYTLSRITRSDRTPSLPTFRMVGIVRSEQDSTRLIEQWRRQREVSVSLTIVYESELANELTALKEEAGCEVIWLPSEELRDINLADLAGGSDWIAGISPQDYYGPNYLLDIALTTRYQDSEVIGKWAKYRWHENRCNLEHQGTEYRPADTLLARCSAIRILAAEGIKASEWLEGLEEWQYKLKEQFAIDRFNYCADVPEGPLIDDITTQVNDIALDCGLSIDELNSAAESSKPKKDVETGSHALSGSLLGRMMTRKASYADHLDQHTGGDASAVIRVSKNPAISTEIDGQHLNLSSGLADGQHEYIYCPENISLERLSNDIGDVRKQGLPVHLEVEPGLNLSLVVLFFDGSGQKLGHVIEPANRNAIINIPENASTLRLGLRLYAGGAATLRRLIFGYRNLAPGQVFGKSDVLVLTNHYPNYDDLYRNGFVHSRVKAYGERGYKVDVFRLRLGQELHYHEFQGVDVMSGSEESLHRLLGSERYKHVLVHFLDEKMWGVLETYIDNIKVTVWIHGAEIQPWWRREYNYQDESALNRAKEESKLRIEFWKQIFESEFKNLRFVFVSKYFANEVMQDVGVALPNHRYQVIHNPVDTDLFNYFPKDKSQRRKILSIRPYASRKYANDLSVKAVIDLSRKEFFSDLEFLFVGDGVLFDEVLEPLRQFPNVKIKRGFLSQPDIARLHKDYGIFLCPTRMDAQGVSKDEAMSSGLVPVTNAVTAIPEFVDDTCGVLVPAEDFSSMALGIANLVNHPGKFILMSKNAAERARSQVGKEKIVAQELAIFRGN